MTAHRPGECFTISIFDFPRTQIAGGIVFMIFVFGWKNDDAFVTGAFDAFVPSFVLRPRQVYPD